MYEILTRGRPSHPLEGKVNLMDAIALGLFVQDPRNGPDNYMPEILLTRTDQSHIRDILSNLDRIWMFDHHSRPTFNQVAGDIKIIHDFVGQSVANFPGDLATELNFPVITMDRVNGRHLSSTSSNYVRKNIYLP